MKKKIKNLTNMFLILGTLAFSASCQRVEEWQKDYLAKRYGSSPDSQKQIEIWQKEAEGYEKEMAEKIKVANKAASVYRSLANAFATQESWYLCVENLNHAINYGNQNIEILYDLATCQGNLARSKNWQIDLTRQAENTLLSILAQDASATRARYQLALIYFYGFGQNSPYRVLNGVLTIEQKDFQAKALQLLQEAADLDKNNVRVLQLMAVVYASMGQRQKALEIINQEIEVLRKTSEKNYTETDEYKQAIESFRRLGGEP